MTPTLVLLAALTATFSVWNAGGALGFPIFVLGVLVFGYLPGHLLLRALGLAAQPLERLTASVTLGVICSVAWFWLVGRTETRPLLWLLPTAALLGFAWRPAWADVREELESPGYAEAGVLALVIAPLAIIPIYFRNLVRQADGGWSYYPLPDVTHHLGFTNELSHAIPPQVPFLPGQPLNYHMGQDLTGALFAALPVVSVPDAALRFVPVLFMALVVGWAVCLGRAVLGSKRSALLLTALMILGEDFSFVPGLLTGSDAPWTIHFFGMPTVVSLYLLNPMLPALGLLCAVSLCLFRSFEARDRRWAVLAVAFLVATGAVKVFTHAHVVTALICVGALALLFRRDPRLLWVGAVALLPILPGLLGDASDAGGRFWVRMQAWPYVPAALIRGGVGDTLLGESAKAAFAGGASVPQLLLYVGAVLPLYLLGTFGSRLAALGLLRRVKRPPSTLTWLLLAFVALGPLISLNWAVTPQGYLARGAAPSAFNNAVWFLVQSKYLAWLLAAPVLIALLRSGRRTVRVAGLALVALAFPSTAQYLSYQFREGSLQRLAPEFEQIRIALERAALPGDVVYARPPFGAAIVTLTRIRSPVYTVFPWSRVPPGELELRVADYRAFWNAWTEGELRSDIVARRSIRFVLDDSAETGAGSEPAGVRLIDASGRFRLYEVGAEVSARRAPKPERSSPTARVASIDIADARKIPGGS